jgi:hypothetical protein
LSRRREDGSCTQGASDLNRTLYVIFDYSTGPENNVGGLVPGPQTMKVDYVRSLKKIDEREEALRMRYSKHKQYGFHYAIVAVFSVVGCALLGAALFVATHRGSAAAATCPSPTPVAPVTGYTISACEDFNSGLGDFSPYNGGGGNTVVGTGRTPSECSDAGGVLELKQTSAGATCGGWMNKFGQRYGYWEVKMRVYTTSASSGSEPHPVLILWPSDGQWTSELDFFETNIGTPATGYLHCTGDPNSKCYTLPANSVDYSQWHVYGIQWTPTSMTGYIDGMKWWSTTNISPFEPLGDSNLTFQLDNVSGSTPVKPAEMDIDWAHMYKSNS